MSRTPRSLALVLTALVFTALVFTACSSSHTEEGCSGSPAQCFASPSPSCCDFGVPGTDQVCMGDTWVCPSGYIAMCQTQVVGGRCQPGIPSDAGVPPPPDYFSCSVTSECALGSTTCCGVCGRETAGDVVAVRGDRAQQYFDDVVCPEARTEPPICPGCAAMPNPNLIASCDAGRCGLLDVENDPDLTSCTDDTECMLRLPSCCACGIGSGAFDTIAIRVDQESALAQRICDPDADCPDCLPSFDPSIRAACVAGACRVVTD
ncbi:MAG: hypothetical protein AB7S26_17505 [Sandaracinaceae bacterium]